MQELKDQEKPNMTRLEIEVGTEKQRKVMQEAQMLDQNGEKAQFFYNSTIQPLTAVTKAIKARFTFTKLTNSSTNSNSNNVEQNLANEGENEQKTTIIQTNIDHAMQDEEEKEFEEKTKEEILLDHNLITFCANVLKIYKCTPEGVFPVLTQKFNDKIVEILRIPTSTFAASDMDNKADSQGEQSKTTTTKPKSAAQLTPDYLFVVTKSYTICLVCFDAEQEKLVVISRGNVGEKAVYFQKQTPYPIFLAPNKSFIAMMPYQNILKVIPLAKSQNSKFLCQMSNSYTERIPHSNVLQIIPLSPYPFNTAQQSQNSPNDNQYDFENQQVHNHQYIGVLCQQAQHFSSASKNGDKQGTTNFKGIHSMKVSLSVEISYLDQQKFELMPLQSNSPFGSTQNKLDSNSVYKIEPMPFGGYLAFDLGSVSYFVGAGPQKSKFQIQLQSANHITAFQQVDEFDFGEDLINQSSNIHSQTEQTTHIRFLFATEAGELFFLAFNRQALQKVLNPNNFNSSQQKTPKRYQISSQNASQNVRADRLMQVSFMARNLSFCNSLVYLDNSVVFYGSKEGDSFLLKLQSETTSENDPDMPYASLIQRFHSLAPIIDLSMARPENVQGQQSELVAVCGWNNQSHISLVRQGVGLKSFRSLADVIPAKLTRQVFSFENIVFLRLYGYENLVGLKVQVENGEKSMNVDGFDVPRELRVAETSHILCLTQIEVNNIKTKEQSKEEKSEAQEEKLNDIEMTFNQNQRYIVFATEKSLKVCSSAFMIGTNQDEKVVQEIILQESEAKLTEVKVQDDLILTANSEGQVTLYKLQAEKIGVSLSKIGSKYLECSISALCLSKSDKFNQQFVYITLYDEPFYSFVVLGLTPRHLKSQEGQLPVLAKIPLSVLVDFDQIKAFQTSSTISKGTAFDNFSKSKQEALLNSNQLEQSEEQKQSSQITEQQQNCVIQQIQSSAACSIEHLMIESQKTDTIFIGFENGRICQFYLDVEILAKTFENPLYNKPYTSHEDFYFSRLPIQSPPEDIEEEQVDVVQNGAQNQINNDMDCEEKDLDKQNLEQLIDASTGPFWGFKVSYTSTLAPKLNKIEISQGVWGVMACSDRPVVFYEAKESIEMHYLAFDQIRQVVSVCPQNESPMLFFEDGLGVVHFSETDSLKRLSINRMLFKMQVTKTLIIQGSDLVLGLFEQPNLEYLDSTKQAKNIIGLLNKGTLSAKAIFELNYQEIANCAEHVQNQGQQFIFVGTAFLRPEEQIPQNGRLLIFEANTMKLVQEYDIAGSVQSILVTRDPNLTCLVLGVNNSVKVFEIQALLHNLCSTRSSLLLTRQAKQLKLVEEVVCGTFIHSICMLPISREFEKCSGVRSLIVADMAGRGISSFNLFARGQQIKLENSARSHLTIWVNAVVPLSESQFSVFDHQGNIFIFKKCLFPSTIQEMLKLELSASFYVGQEVQCATFGSLHAVNDRSRIEQKETCESQKKAFQKQEAYVRPSPETLAEYEKFVEKPKSLKQFNQKFLEMQSSKRKRLENSSTGLQQDDLRVSQSGNSDIDNVQRIAQEEPEPKEETKNDQEQSSTALMINTGRETRGTVQKLQDNEDRKVKLAQMELDVHDLSQSHRILQEPDFARKFAEKTLEEMYALHNQKNSLVYGTSEGSIGQLQQITPKVYLLCLLLQIELDGRTRQKHDLTQQRRVDFRTVKGSTCLMTEVSDAEQNVSNGIIDGDFVESILEASRAQQIQITRGICCQQQAVSRGAGGQNFGIIVGGGGEAQNQGRDGDEYFTELVVQIITLLKNLH